MARDTLSFISHFSNNALFIIDALGESDSQTAIHLNNTVRDATSESRPGYCHYVKVECASQFVDVLQRVNDKTKEGLRPILHIEAHGDMNLGMKIAASEEMISWAQLMPQLQEINKNSKNNLGVVMATCFGFYAIKPLRIEEPCPFYFLIGADEPVPVGYIDTEVSRFYLELIRSNSLDVAMEKIEDKFRQFHAEKFFYTTFGRYMSSACMGRGAQRRVERLLTMVVEGGAITNRASLRTLRKLAKALVRSSERAFDKYSSRFLHGRKSVTYEEFRQFVRGGND